MEPRCQNPSLGRRLPRRDEVARSAEPRDPPPDRPGDVEYSGRSPPRFPSHRKDPSRRDQRFMPGKAPTGDIGRSPADATFETMPTADAAPPRRVFASQTPGDRLHPPHADPTAGRTRAGIAGSRRLAARRRIPGAQRDADLDDSWNRSRERNPLDARTNCISIPSTVNRGSPCNSRSTG